MPCSRRRTLPYVARWVSQPLLGFASMAHQALIGLFRSVCSPQGLPLNKRWMHVRQNQGRTRLEVCVFCMLACSCARVFALQVFLCTCQWCAERCLRAVQDFEKAGTLRDREMELKAQISAITGAAKETTDAETETSAEGGGPMVTEADIANIVAQWTGIPVEKVRRAWACPLCVELQETSTA